MKVYTAKSALFVAVMALTAAMPAATQAGGKVIIPFVLGNFGSPTTIDNPLFPLKPDPALPGAIFTFASEVDDECEVNTTQVLSDSIAIVADDGVTTLNQKVIHPSGGGNLSVITVYDVVWTTDCENVDEMGYRPSFDDFEEVTFDWYAQDDDGNVWYVGEWTYDCEDGDCELGEGAWETGVDGATPGIIMLAHPRSGQQYDQELYEDFAEDKAKVSRTKAWVSLYRDDAADPQDFHNCLVTKEWTPLSPGDIEQKSYCPANGNAPFPGGQVNTKELHGKTVVEELIDHVVTVPPPPNNFFAVFQP